MKKRTKLITTILLAVSVNVSYGGENCLPPDVGSKQTPMDVFRCFQRVFDAQQDKIQALQEQIQQLVDTKADRVYEVIKGNFTWHEAKADAEKRGGYLATITSEAEWFFIQKMLGDSLLSDANIWIGATDEKDEGNWRWVTGEPWGYTRWNTSQPDNAGNAEHYLHIYASTGYNWNDLPNSYSHPISYLLEK
ncbi:C-type lectin domain-containing protein [Candidatus Parabeggiatoa sp. HSG14]|uniref:C-type lectin domain-containing protein n=1 Tax=Candidatus Parabeggiatoa sp. HSG14 TaxID=3055593 RepID=UPI0025A7FD2A|nr:C-type lectin domain-containing protein [Thiotrichales bacterium HSG14]